MTTTRRTVLSLLTGLPVVALVATRATACSTATPVAANIHEVEIAIFQFQPSPISVKTGDTVRWINHDGIEHSATAGTTTADGKPDFDTGLFEKGESREITFTQPGTYDYFCTRHPSMKGTVVVEG